MCVEFPVAKQKVDIQSLSSAFTFVADIICIDYVRTVIGQEKPKNTTESTDQKPLYITCMTITILGAVLAVVRTLE